VPFDTFETKDGWVAIACATDEHWANLTKAMNRPDLQEDQDLKVLLGRVDRIDELTKAISEWTGSHTKEQINEVCQKHHVPASPLLEVNEILNDKHLHERGFLKYYDTPNGKVAYPNSPIRFAGSALAALKKAPNLGEHTKEVLSELLNISEDEFENLKNEGAFS
jgi:crotonobetainyl-CoA:carnitine CoA-transferase CaiB-like acyl-CoA transferase